MADSLDRLLADAMAGADQQMASVGMGGGGPVAHEESSWAPILHMLGYLSRPLHAVGGAIESGMSDNPDESALSGAWKGLTGERHTTPAKALGVPQPTSEDAWLPWLGKLAANMAVDLPFDPLTYAFVPAKASGLVGRQLLKAGIPEGRSLAGHAVMTGVGPVSGENLLNYLASTSTWRNLARRAPDTEELRYLNEAGDLVKREGQTFDLRKATLEADKLAKDAYPDLTREQIFRGIEEKDPAFARAAEIYAPVLNEQGKLFDYYRTAKESLGLDAPFKLALPEDMEYIAHVSKAKREWKPEPRLIETWLDAEGNPIVTGKLKDPRTQVKVKDFPDDPEYWYHGGETPIQVFKRPATLAETRKVAPDIEFMDDPFLAQYISGTGYARKGQLFSFMKKLENKGMLKRVDEANPLEKGWEEFRIPGGKVDATWQGPSAVVRNLEQKTGVVGPYADAVLKFMDTPMMQRFGDLTNWFKTNVLGSPGFVAGNSISDLSLEYLGSKTGAWNMPRRWYESISAMRGSPQEVVPGSGVSLGDFAQEMWRHDLMRNISSDTGYSYLSGQPKHTTEILSKLGVPETGVKAGQTVADTLGRYNQFWLDIATVTENRAKLSNAIDYIKSHSDDFLAATKAGDKGALDKLYAEAARAGHSSKLDYHDLPYFASRVMPQLIPFYNFQSGIVSRLAKGVLNDAAKMRRLESTYEQIMTPLDERDRAIADEWIKKDAPITGMFGRSFDDMANYLGLPPVQGQRMGLAGRFLPFTAPFKLATGETPFGWANPFIKAPIEMAMNYNVFKGRPIDTLAGGGLSGLINPIIGKPYEMAAGQQMGQTLPAAWDYLLSVSPASRHLMELNRLGSMTGLLPEDPYKQPTNVPETGLWWLTGGKTYPFDATRFQMRRTRENAKVDTAMRSAMKYAIQKNDMPTAMHYQDLILKTAQDRWASGYVE